MARYLVDMGAGRRTAGRPSLLLAWIGMGSPSLALLVSSCWLTHRQQHSTGQHSHREPGPASGKR
eukprot:scaffold198_cov169-Ochromonas_danica.AAC.11